MMNLDFSVEQWSRKLRSDPNKWPEEIYRRAFIGRQLFEINDVDFSATYPILGFARELKSIAYNLQNQKKVGIYGHPTGELPLYLEFTPNRNRKNVIIRRRKEQTEEIQKEAEVTLSELMEKSTLYLETVFNYCCSEVAELKDNEEVSLWMHELSVTSFDWCRRYF